MAFFGNSMPMQYFFTEKDGSKTEVQLERWIWVVEYKDGSCLVQFDQNGTFHQIGEIDQDNVRAAALISVDTNQRIDIPWVDGMRLIHKYRNVVFNAFTEIERHVRVYIWGWKSGNEYVYIFVLPDDRLIISPTDNINLELFGI